MTTVNQPRVVSFTIADLLEAKAACAEMRAALESVLRNYDHGDDGDFILGVLAKSDLGKGWASPEQVAAAQQLIDGLTRQLAAAREVSADCIAREEGLRDENAGLAAVERERLLRLLAVDFAKMAREGGS